MERQTSKSFSLLKYGLPFVSFIVLGSFLLREFTSIRYEVYNYKRRYVGTKRRDNSEQEEEETTTDAEQSLNKTNIINPLVQDKSSSEAIEPDLKEMISLGRKDDWKNIRGPRPWEDNREYNELIAKLKSKSK